MELVICKKDSDRDLKPKKERGARVSDCSPERCFSVGTKLTLYTGHIFLVKGSSIHLRFVISLAFAH